MSCNCKPIYAKRDIEAQGDHYTKHVCHMTGERLHAKSDIAAELAHRDIIIEKQQAEIDAGIVTPEYLQSWIDRAMETEATMKLQTDAVRLAFNRFIYHTGAGFKGSEHDDICGCGECVTCLTDCFVDDIKEALADPKENES